MPPPGQEAQATLDLTGRTLGDFHVLRRLGQGGMGQVYLAEQVSLKRKVALKILRPELAANAQALQRFKLEAESVARTTHPNIVQVYAFGTAEGISYMALEYVEGRNLREYVARKGPPELLVSLSIMRQVAAALQRAGELGIVHRDIKPENILLTRKGEVKVADFGLSRSLTGDQPLNLTQTGVTMGTPLYMSPEQVEGKPVDPRTDIYSFGVTCYFMLAGQPPFRGETAFEVALQHIRAEPKPLADVRPDLPPGLCAIVHKMMARDPASRYQTGRDLLRDVVRLRDGLSGLTGAVGQATVAEPVPAATVTPVSEALARPPRQRRPALLVAVSLLLAAGAGALFALGEKRRAGPLPGHRVAPADAFTVEALSLPHKKEQRLRDTVEQYLGLPDGSTEHGRGFGVCLDLGLLYLQEHRLDDARKLFARLDRFHKTESYHVLGHLGLGIVLALQNEHRESNRHFQDVFQGAYRLPGKGRPRPVDPNLREMMQTPQWRYWLVRARDYNLRNGLPRIDVPWPLRRGFGAAPLGKAPGRGK
jgi:serine/threonine-protein kinase